jgi:hypothetical protein
MIMSFFSSRGWESWDIANRPLIPERMPVLIDDDLLLEDGPSNPRPSVAVNQWLRELPASGCPSPGSWESYARVLKEWAEFLSVHGVGLFDSRDQLKLALGKYAEYRAAGPAERRFAATTSCRCSTGGRWKKATRRPSRSPTGRRGPCSPGRAAK